MRTSTNKLKSTMLIALSLLCGLATLNAQKGFQFQECFEQSVLTPSLEECDDLLNKGSQWGTDVLHKTPATTTLDLALTKELAQGQSLEVDPGDWVTFTIYIHNQGDEAASSIFIADYIPAYMTLMDSNWLTDLGYAYHIMPGPIAPGTTSQIDIHMMVNADAPHDMLMNCAEIGSASFSGVTVFNDLDSTFDANANNDGPVTDNELNNNNYDEDDHDCAYVKVLGEMTTDPCPNGVVNCSSDTFCTMPITPITICPDVCGINGNYTITNSESAYHCSLTAAGGCVTYTPVPGMELLGSDIVTLTIVADNGCTYNYTANVTIGNCSGNTFPVAIFDEVFGNCTGIGINPMVNDYDLDPGDVITICGFDQPNNGLVTQNGDILYYMPDPGFYGVDEFLYTICDGNGGTAQANIIVNVSQCNSAPVASDDYYTSLCDKIWMYVLDNDYDAESPINSICDYTEPATGSLLFYDNHFSYIPAAEYNGPVNFTYTICDPDGLTSTATVYIDIEQCNESPVAGDDVYASTCEKIWMHVLDNDYDSNGGEYICDYTTPSAGTLYFYDTFFTYIPESGYNGPVTYQYTLCDPQGLQSVATVTINVACNEPPVAYPDTYATTCDAIDMYVLDNDTDPDGTVLTICDYTLPSMGSLVLNGNYFTYTPVADYTGPVTFTYTACDEYGLSSMANVSINVDCGCTNPPMNVCTEPLQGIELCPEFCELEGPYTLTNVHSTWDCSITQNDNGCVTYMPLPGFFGTDVVTLDACDQFGNCDTYIINVTVAVGGCDQSGQPQAIGDTYSIDCGATVLNVLDNDIHPNGGTLTICDFDAVTVGTLLFSNNSFTYTPPNDLVGLVSFSYTVCNELGETSEAQVTINYNCICNDGPYQECVAPQTQLMLCPDVCSLSNYTFTDAVSTYHCSLTVIDQCVQYVAVPGFFGQDIVTLTACDNSGNCIDIVYNIEVGDCGPISEAPVAIYDNVSGGCNPLLIDVTANDQSPSGEPITICDFEQPNYGSVVLINGQFQYNPSPGFNGVDEFLYTLCSQNGPGNSAVVTINVNCGNNPSISASDDIVYAGCNMTKLIVLFNDVSSTGETLSICGFDQPSFGSVYQAGEFLFYTPNDNFTGNDSLQYSVCDESGNSTTATVFITVDCGMVGVNPPGVHDDLVYGGCDLTKVVALGNDVSVDGDVLTICGFTQPANGTVYESDGFLFYTPNDGFTGTDNFQYTACDAQGAAATANVTMVIECDPPCVDGELEACTQMNTPVDLCVTFCSPNAYLNNIVSTLNANIIPLNQTCFRYIPSFTGGKDILSVSYCDDQGLCETIMINMFINDDCIDPGFNGAVADPVVLEEKCDVQFPNGFSPNGDGVNELFRPMQVANCYEDAMAEVKIFNSHGQMICEGYDELHALSWNGKFGSSDEIVAAGTYFYIITVEENNEQTTFKGFIEVR